MEISEKSNFRFKALVVALITTILMATSTSAFGFSLFNLKPENEPFLNRKVYFTGAATFYKDGRETKLYKKGSTDRRNYTADNPGCGIITIVSGESFYVAGEGWIKRDQIMDDMTERYITVEINPIENGVNGYLHIDGEYLEIESDNNAVVAFDKENQTLTANAKGATEITFHNTKTGEDTKIAAVVLGSDQSTDELRDEEERLDADKIDGEGLTLQLNIPEKSLSAELDKLTVTAINDKFRVSAEDAKASVALVIDEENGQFGIAAEGEGAAKVEYMNNEGEYQEAARIDVEGNVKAIYDTNTKTLGVKAEATEKLTILDKFAVALQERAAADIDFQNKSAKATAGASVLAGKADEEELPEVAGVDAGISYTYGDKDPKGAAEARLLGNTFGSMEEEAWKDIPVSKVFEGLKSLVSRVK